MSVQWEKQKREVDSYNVFFSAFQGRNGARSLFDLGYRLVGVFMRISDSREGVESDPDFVLYNGGTLLLVEVKSGQNINDRAIEQMEDAKQISIEAGREFLRDAEMEQYDHTDLDHIEPLIVYYGDFLEECQNSEGCLTALNELATHAPVLSQTKGEQIELAKGEIEDASLRNFLTDGIPLPKFSSTQIYLTDNINREILAYSISHDCVRTALSKDSEITIKPEDVIERYRNREVPITKVNDSLRFLNGVGACTNPRGDEYTFRRSNMSNILGVEEHLREIRVIDALEGAGIGQQSLNDF